MGLLGKSFTSKFKTITKLAVSRIAILKNQHKARCSYARSDVAQLLNLGYHDRALLRVEQWITEQNMLDVFVMIENCCNFLRERAEILDKNNECLHELQEATSSLIYASSRCGEFPELHKIKELFTSKFGKEFADHAIMLHKNSRVNSKMIQKFTTRCPAMEIRMKALKKIASDIGVTLHLKQDPMPINVNKLNVDQGLNALETRKCSIDDPKHKENNQGDPENLVQEKKGYKDAVAAVQEALETASFGIEVTEQSNHGAALGKVHVHHMVTSIYKPEDEVISKSNHAYDLKELEGRVKEITKQFACEESHSSQNPKDNIQASRNTELVSSEYVDEDTNRQCNMLDELESAKSLLIDNNVNDHNSRSGAAAENEHFHEERNHPSCQAIRWNPQRSQVDPTVTPTVRGPVMGSSGGTYFSKQIHTHHEHVEWKMMSVRTRQR